MLIIIGSVRETLGNIYFAVYTLIMIKEAKIFKNGQSQAVRLPKEYRFNTKSVYINKIGGCVVLIPKDNPWKSLIDACGKFSDDFMETRDQGVEQKREGFD